MNKPAISVVLPSYNGIRYIREQLDALAKQELPGGFEVIVADNGSSDGTPDLLDDLGRSCDWLRIVDASETPGQSFARNKGASVARASLLAFLDQDDLVGATYLANLHAALQRHRLVAARVDTIKLNPGWIQQVRSVAQTTALPCGPLPWALGGTLGMHKDLFEELGGFDVGIQGSGEDVDLCWRAAQLGVQVEFVPNAVLHYRFPSSLAELFSQGRRYGQGAVAVQARYRSMPGVRKREFLSSLRLTIGALRLVVFGHDRGERGQGCFLLGRRLGIVQGALRSRSTVR